MPGIRKYNGRCPTHAAHNQRCGHCCSWAQTQTYGQAWKLPHTVPIYRELHWPVLHG